MRPPFKQPFQLVTHGAVVAITLWVGFSMLFSFYVSNLGSFNATYGALAGVIVLLLYMFFSFAILLLGAEINDVIRRHRLNEQRQK